FQRKKWIQEKCPGPHEELKQMKTITSRSGIIGKAFAVTFGMAWLLASATVASGQTKIEYNRDVRPILAENCFACHGPDSAARKASLRLDQRDDAIKIGAITPGKPNESALIERITSSDPNEVMPPPKTRKKLTSLQKEILKRWIGEGAEYQL